MKVSVFAIILCFALGSTAAAEDLVVPASSWTSKGSSPGFGPVRMKTQKGLIERMLVDQELRGDKKETRHLRTYLNSGGMIFSWSLREGRKDEKRIWKYLRGSVSFDGVTDLDAGDKKNYFRRSVSEVKVIPYKDGFNYSFRLRITLNKRVYDAFVTAKFTIPAPGSKKNTSYTMTWNGPFKKGAKNKDLVVSSSTWKSHGSSPDQDMVKVKLHSSLIERMLVDQELKGDKRETKELRGFLGRSSLTFIWTQDENMTGKKRAWKHLSGTVVPEGMTNATSSAGKDSYYKFSVVDVKVTPNKNGYHCSFTLRFTLNKHAYDSFVTGRFIIPAPDSKEETSYTMIWKGPFKKGTKKKTKSKPAVKAPKKN